MASFPNGVSSNTAVPNDLSETDRHRLLSAERRRVTLEVLAEHSTPITLGDVAVAVASREEDDGVHPDESAVHEVAISLHHHHLPKMVNWGVVEFDYDTGEIR